LQYENIPPRSMEFRDDDCPSRALAPVEGC
jgi:hypothetical protein